MERLQERESDRASRFELDSLIQAVLDGLKECIRLGRDLLVHIGKGFKWITKYIGNKIAQLLDSKVFWKYAKLIPLINTVFGSARVLRQFYLGEYGEKLKSFLYGLGGLAAIFIPLYLGVACMWAFLLGSTINNLFGGGTNFIVDMWRDERLRTATWGQMETELYERVIKVTPLLAAGYCPIRALVYLCQNNTREAKASAWDFIIGSVSIGLGLVLIHMIDCNPRTNLP